MNNLPAEQVVYCRHIEGVGAARVVKSVRLNVSGLILSRVSMTLGMPKAAAWCRTVKPLVFRMLASQSGLHDLKCFGSN